VSCRDDLVLQKVRSANQGCESEKEVVRPASFKEYGTLNTKDLEQFNDWFLQQDCPSFKQVTAKLASLRHYRWAAWHILALDNPNILPENSVPLLLAPGGGEGTWTLGMSVPHL